MVNGINRVKRIPFVWDLCSEPVDLSSHKPPHPQGFMYTLTEEVSNTVKCKRVTQQQQPIPCPRRLHDSQVLQRRLSLALDTDYHPRRLRLFLYGSRDFETRKKAESLEELCNFTSRNYFWTCGMPVTPITETLWVIVQIRAAVTLCTVSLHNNVLGCSFGT